MRLVQPILSLGEFAQAAAARNPNPDKALQAWTRTPAVESVGSGLWAVGVWASVGNDFYELACLTDEPGDGVHQIELGEHFESAITHLDEHGGALVAEDVGNALNRCR